MSIEKHTIAWGANKLELGEKTCIMGVVNVTPDSFSDGGHFYATEDAVAHGIKLVEDGAHILDVGGESTRPFSEAVPAEEEIRRVIPVISELAEQVAVPISIDTTKAETARQALEAGAAIINDVGALHLDPDLAGVAAEYQVPVILMHMLGTPRDMQLSPTYTDIISEITEFLDAAAKNAVDRGISSDRIIIDPGIGFGKTLSHNLLLIRELKKLSILNMPILVGPSRKAFIRTLLKGESMDDLKPDLPIVETGTQAAVCAAVLNGAHIVRVHDVAETAATVKIIDAVKNAGA